MGGLGIHNLQTLGWALQMKWLWLQKTEPNKPWATFQLSVPAPAKALFELSVVTTVGDGTSTMFWTDRWLLGKTVAELAPELMHFVRRRGWRRRTVQQALQGNAWIKDIVGGLNTVACWQFLQLWDLVRGQVTMDGTPDLHVWTPSASGIFTTKSAYERFFTGSTTFEPYKRLWRSWAPLRVKIFVWMAVLNRCWTADRLARCGLQHPERCVLCDQEEETVQHILTSCVFARQIWSSCLSVFGLQAATPSRRDRSLADWWRRAGRRVPRQWKKGFNSLVMLVTWELWKCRNE